MIYYIGTFSKKINLSIDTLRYYEKIGLILPNRDQNNRRIYSDIDIEWLKFILKLKETNMPIKEIQKYSKLRYQGNSTLEERLIILEEQMKKLKIEKSKLDNNILNLKNKINIYKKLIQNKN